MKKYLIAFLLIYPICSFSMSNKDNGDKKTKLKKGAVAPNFNFDINGQQVSFASYTKGKVVLLTFWATWCPYCLAELPHVQNEIWDLYKNNKDFVLLAFARNQTQSIVDSFKMAKGYTLPLLPDTNKTIYNLYAQQYIPRNYIIDRTGHIVFVGLDYNAKEFARLKKVLKKTLEATSENIN